MQNTQQKSEVEQFYYRIQQHMQGNIKWENLNAAAQHHFVQAVNIILQITSQRN